MKCAKQQQEQKNIAKDKNLGRECIEETNSPTHNQEEYKVGRVGCHCLKIKMFAML